MKLSGEERRALGFVGLLLLLSAGVRLAGAPAPPEVRSRAVDAAVLGGESRAAAAEQARRKRPLAQGERIDPNRAPAAELDRLPGVGPALAERIVAARDSGPPFGGAADMARVRGLGERSIAKLEPHLDFSSVPWRPGPPRASSSSSSSPPARPLDLNRASPDQLQELPGIGPALARRIVEEREANGPFREVGELVRVPGIGPATLERLAPRIRVDP